MDFLQDENFKEAVAKYIKPLLTKVSFHSLESLCLDSGLIEYVLTFLDTCLRVFLHYFLISLLCMITLARLVPCFVLELAVSNFTDLGNTLLFNMF